MRRKEGGLLAYYAIPSLHNTQGGGTLPVGLSISMYPASRSARGMNRKESVSPKNPSFHLSVPDLAFTLLPCPLRFDTGRSAGPFNGMISGPYLIRADPFLNE